MISEGAVRGIVAAAAVAACIALAGCNAEQAAFVTNAKANKPIPQKLINEIQAKQMDPQSPILVRLFKQEAELEVWKQDKTGRYALLQTYPICRWSGELGPKMREGDRQAPEGFYNITPGQMNPESQFYLAFNMGYPNAFDRSLGRTGSQLMVHGDCSSRGCYAMTDEQISEIYALGRESFFGGQRSFQVQAYPFRMTPQNMAKHRNSPHMPFWKMLKQGNDHFEVTHLEPKVDVCEQRYVFNAEKDPNATRPLNFSPAGKCPAYQVSDDIAQAVAEKQRKDEFQTAELISRGTPSIAARRGIDGGMHPLFAAKTPNGSTGLSENKNYSMAAYAAVPAVPPTVNPPASADGVVTPTMTTTPASGGDFMSTAAPAPKPQAAPANVRVATASSSESGGFFSGLAKRIGFGGSDSAPTASTRPPAAQPPRQARTQPAVRQAAPKPPAPVRAAESKPAPKPVAAAPAPSAQPQPRGTAIAGAQPVVPSNAFENRWSVR
ncbi:MAG: murein L,D-transpeptidase family protein [Xanthobacteraceae bacterium]